MGIPAVGDIVVINFPFADQKVYKKRPALVVARGSLNTVILCQITSSHILGVPVIKITPASFSAGALPLVSYVRIDKLVTVDEELAGNRIATLHKTAIREVCQRIQSLFV